jgi:hypothetical protein
MGRGDRQNETRNQAKGHMDPILHCSSDQGAVISALPSLTMEIVSELLSRPYFYQDLCGNTNSVLGPENSV